MFFCEDLVSRNLIGHVNSKASTDFVDDTDSGRVRSISIGEISEIGGSLFRFCIVGCPFLIFHLVAAIGRAMKSVESVV